MPHQVERGLDALEHQHCKGGGEGECDDDRRGGGRHDHAMPLAVPRVKMRGTMASTGRPISSSSLSRRRTELSIVSSKKTKPAPRPRPATIVIMKSLGKSGETGFCGRRATSMTGTARPSASSPC